MAVTYTLGRDYTVSGLTAATDLTVTRSGERIDITTRFHPKPFKSTVAGFGDLTFECSVYAEATTEFTIGKSYSVTLNGNALGENGLICMTANREEPQEGIITYRLTFKPGLESEIDNQIPIGPGEYRA